MGKITQTLDRGALLRRPAFQSRLFIVDVETGILWVYLMKLPVEDLSGVCFSN
jgi:hypothetical protein